jgi:putative exosortase-associated protein (TIGR04073 family)
MGWKALDGFANINTALMEIPKNIIQTTNESNIAFGFIGGTVKGILNTMGRFMTGLTDLATFPIVTKPIVNPGHVWEDFDAETTYGEVFRLDNTPSTRFEKMEKCDVVGPPC